jgi:diaminopimelate decarboxylase
MRTVKNKLFIGDVSAEALAKQFSTPLYVYDASIITKQYQALATHITYENLAIHYACKANANITILKLLRSLGCNIECVSRGEVLQAKKAGFSAKQILYTCTNIDDDELKFLIKQNVTMNIDSLRQLERYGKLNKGGSVSVRINDEIAGGHHKHVLTGGPKSKFGIHLSQTDEIKRIAKQYKLRIIGVHHHIGSNILSEAILIQAMESILHIAKGFSDLEFVDIGGGFGIPYHPEEPALDMVRVGAAIGSLFERFCKEYGKQLTLVIEPGRYIVAESGVLLARVTEIKPTPYHTYVGLDTGMNHLIRPALYEAYHPIVNASRVEGPKQKVAIAGNVCETSDVFDYERELTQCKEGDIVAILHAGAYGFSMSSPYNLRAQPAEVLVNKKNASLIRARGRI